MNDHNPQQNLFESHGQQSVVLPPASQSFPQVPGVHGEQGEPATPLQRFGHETHAGKLPDICRNKHRGNPLSEAANVRVAPVKNSMRELIYSAIAASEAGLTLKEIAAKFNKQLNQISGRVTELLVAGRIERADAVRDGCAVLRTKGTGTK